MCTGLMKLNFHADNPAGCSCDKSSGLALGKCTVRMSGETPAILRLSFLFLSLSKQMSGEYLDQATTVSFHFLSSSSSMPPFNSMLFGY
jgi:hypothetical protein